MREYGQIQASFWTDPDIQTLSDGAKTMAAYLLTGPHSNGIGCFRLPLQYLAVDMNWTEEKAEQCQSELEGIEFAEFCPVTKFILVKKFLKWNPVVNPKVAAARMKEFESISSKTGVMEGLILSMKKYGGKHFTNEFYTLCEERLNGIRSRSETVSDHDPEPYRNQPDPTLPDPERKDTMSGKPDNAACSEIIDYLNRKAGRQFEKVDSNLHPIRARLKEGRTVDDVKKVIDNRVKAWSDDPKMKEYLRPATLFNASKFNSYFGNLNVTNFDDWSGAPPGANVL